jgi:toxin FitB
VNVLDSSGWLEIFADGPNADTFAEVAKASDELLVPVVNLYEVFKKVLLDRGESAALEAVAVMLGGRVVDLDEGLALSAAKLSAELHLTMADSMILAAARAHGAILWTQDQDFEGIEDVRYIPRAP